MNRLRHVLSIVQARVCRDRHIVGNNVDLTLGPSKLCEDRLSPKGPQAAEENCDQ